MGDFNKKQITLPQLTQSKLLDTSYTWKKSTKDNAPKSMIDHIFHRLYDDAEINNMTL